MVVLFVAFLSIIVYLKVQQKKGRLPNKDHSSSGSISKSTQSTLQPPSAELKESMVDIRSCVFNEVRDSCDIFTEPYLFVRHASHCIIAVLISPDALECVTCLCLRKRDTS